MFVIFVKNFIAKCVVFNALKSYIDNETAVALRKKAREQCDSGEFVLDTFVEVEEWNKILLAYNPKTKAEQTVREAMLRSVTNEIEDVKCIELDWRYACMD